jgi:hypothetical protein
MYMAFREKTGCRQYIFDTAEEMVKYFSRKNYRDEPITYRKYHKDTNVLDHKGWFLAGSHLQMDLFK